MSSHEHLWKKGFSKPNSTPVPNPFKMQRRRAKVLSPTLSPQAKLQLKQQADQISQLGYNSQKIPLQSPAPTAEASPIQSKAGDLTNQQPTTDAVEIQADASEVQQETKEPDDLAFVAASDASAADSSIQRQEIPDSEAEAIPESYTDNIDNPEEETEIQAKAKQPARNFLELPINAPGTSPSSIQRQGNLGESGNPIQQQSAENEEKVEPEAELEAQESDETIQRQEIPEAEEDEISSSESQTVQRQGETSDTPNQQTDKSEEYHNFLDIPVNVPGIPSSSIPRQVNLGRLSNQVVQPIKPTPNPGLNRLNTFKSQRIESPVKPVNPVLNQSPAPTVQRQDNTEDEDIQNQPLQEPEAETVQKKGTQSQSSDATATPSLEQSTPQQENESEQEQQEIDTLKPKSLSDKSPEFLSDKQQLPLQQGQVKPESLEAKKLEDSPLELTSNKEQQIPQTQVDPEATKENQQPETNTKEQPQQKVETPVESQAETGTGGSMGNAPTPPTAMTHQTQDTGLGGGTEGEGAASAPQEAVTITAEDPGKIIEQLKNTPPTQAISAYAQAETASVPALDKQKQNLQETIPEIPAPTGLPAQGTEATQTAEKAATKAAQSKGEPQVEVKAEGSAQSEANYDTQVSEAPPAPPPAPTQLAGNNVQQEGQNDEALSRSAQQALSNVQMNTRQISTSAGERPNVDLNGEANPAQIQSAQVQSNQEVQTAKVQAVADTNQDFGENSIFPKASNETLKANKELSAIAPPTIQGLEAPAVPGEAAGGLNQSLTPFLREKIGAEQEKYQAGKDKFDTDTVQARADADQEIAGLDEETKQKQIAEQEQAKTEVTQARQEWRTELDTVDQDYQEKASQASQEQRDKIDTEKLKGEDKAAKHLEDAEKEAEQEKQKADKEANKKKEEGEKESGGFLGWVKSKAKALIDGIKQAVNFIYDNLRKAVKAIFDVAKKLATAAIDLARQAIVGLIKGFGAILKGLVKVAFAAFPEIAKKINAKIDQAVKKAEKAVNAAADLLKKGISAVLDFLANTLDSLLGLIQDIYNGALTVIGMIINGEFAELFKRIGNLVEAAKTAPAQFETAALEELLGGNLDQPLSPQELSQAAAMGISLPNQQGENKAQGSETSELPSPPWTTQNVGVDGVENNMEFSPELVTQLMEQTNGDGEVMLGESNHESRSMEAILAEATGQKEEGGEQAPETIPDDGLSPKQRAEIKWEMMKQGISQWWSENWLIVLGAGVVGVAGFIAANIVTGGAITAALPTIMAVVGPLFAGVTIAQIGGHIRDYLAKGWEGEIQPGGKSLAKGLAAGAIELVSWLTFKVGGAALKGAKAAAKGAKALAKGGIQVAKKVTQAVIKGAKYLIQKGKVLFKGIAGSGIGKQFKRLQDLGQGLLNKMRFKAFRIRVANRKFRLEGQINPWVLLATGELEWHDTKNLTRHKKGNYTLGEEVTTAGGKKGIVAGVKKDGSQVIKNLRQLQEIAEARGWSSQNYLEVYKTFTAKRLKTLLKNVDELPKTRDQWLKFAGENSDKVKGLDVEGVIKEYGQEYPREVDRFLSEWFAGKYTRELRSPKHVENLASHGIPQEVLERIAQDPELKELALMMRPSNAAHATNTRNVTLPKPGTAEIQVSEGSAMTAKALAKNAGPNPNPRGFYSVKIKVNGAKQEFVFIDDRGSIKLVLAEEAYAAGMKSVDNLEQLKNSEALIPLPEGNVATSISSQKTPPVSTSLGNPEKGLVGTSLYQGTEEIKYLAVSQDGGKTYYLEEAGKILENDNILPAWEGKVVGSDIDLLAMLSPDGSINSIADINRIAAEKPDLFNALIEAFAANRKNIPSLPDRKTLAPGATYEFPHPGSDIQHGAQIPYAYADFLEKQLGDISDLTPAKVQAALRGVKQEMGAAKFREEVEKIINISDKKTVVTLKGKNYEIPLRDVPMLYRLLGHPFPIEAYLPV